MPAKKPVEEIRVEFVGKPYSRELAMNIEKTGYGFSTSLNSGRVVGIHETHGPKPRRQ